VSPLHIQTPVLRAPPGLFAHPGPVWLKMDALQPSGSFKLRGVGRLVQQAVADGAREIVCASGGNAGFAAAYAAQAMGVPVTIVLPESSAKAVAETIAARGAHVIVHGASWDDAHAHATALADERGAAYVHPFDHPLLWDGHATLIDELVRDGIEFDAVVTSVGGGGLLAGIIEGLRRHGLHHVPVIAVETVGADSLHQSLAAGEAITLPAITSIATSLGARRVSDHALQLAREHPVTSVTVTDAQAVQACLRFADATRVLVEPACGAALAALDAHPGVFARLRAPLVEVCGGIGVTLGRLQSWSAPPMAIAEEQAHHLDVPTLRGKGCTLRALTLADAPAIRRHADDEAVWRNLFEGFPRPYTLADAEAWCGGVWTSAAFGHVWAIEVGGEAIGCISVVPQQGWMGCNAEVGYWIGQKHWGRGITSEALQLVTDWAWDEQPALTRLFAPIFAWNTASQRVAARCGYVKEAELPKSAIKAGRVIDRVQYAAYRPH
jgi:L-serine/L-threonine ammonia-lyase